MNLETLLHAQGTALAPIARNFITRNPSTRIAGVILVPGHSNVGAFDLLLSPADTRTLQCRSTVGIVPRACIESLLRTGPFEEYWMEQGWQRQTVLPVVLFAHDLHLLDFFPLCGPSSL